jgi:hypothetical protein
MMLSNKEAEKRKKIKDTMLIVAAATLLLCSLIMLALQMLD